MRQKTKATKSSISIFGQLVQRVPGYYIEALAKEEKIKAREFSYSSQLYLLMLGHLLHAFSLNEVTDISQVHESELKRIRRISSAHLNTFSYANRTRNPEVAEKFYWMLRSYLQQQAPEFVKGRNPGPLSRFHLRKIYAIDSSVLELCANCIDWAEYRKKKSAVKMHMRMNIANMLPSLVILDVARPHDSSKMDELCADLKSGDIVVADRGYQKFTSFQNLASRGIFYVVRQKNRAKYKVVKKRKITQPGIISDEEIEPTIRLTKEKYTSPLRRVEAEVEVDGQIRRMVFLTNNLTWTARTIADIYKGRWNVELLFKELKQTLQLQSFYGTNANAVKWQIWAALIVHLLLRYMKFISGWKSSYSRFVGVVRSALWIKRDAIELIKFYGIASPQKCKRQRISMPYLPGFERLILNAIG